MNIMVDLETLDTKPESVILSAGLVAFTDKEIVDVLYVSISMQDQIDMGRSINEDTIKWWMQQSALAQKVFFEEKTSAQNAATLIYNFLAKYDEPKLWSNGADFDVPILRSYLEGFKFQRPWKFWHVNCFRTHCNTLKKRYRSSKDPNSGISHNALDDARNQALHVLATWNG